jgi:hypothetical protein
MKNVTLLSAMLLIAGGLMGQTDGMLGIKAGLNTSTLTVSQSVNRTGLHAGLFYRSDPVVPFGFQAELLYSVRGADWRVRIPFTNIGQEASLRLNYIDLPVMAVYRPLPALELHGGGYVGYLISSQYQATGTLINETGELGHGNFNALDAGALLGLAVNIGPAQLGARYNFGFVNVSGSSAANFVLGSAQNRFGQVFASFILPTSPGSTTPRIP